MKKRNAVLDYLACLGLRVVSAVFHIFPIDLNLRTARRLGDVVWWIINNEPSVLKGVLGRKHKQRIMDNLHLALGGSFENSEDG